MHRLFCYILENHKTSNRRPKCCFILSIVQITINRLDPLSVHPGLEGPLVGFVLYSNSVRDQTTIRTHLLILRFLPLREAPLLGNVDLKFKHNLVVKTFTIIFLFNQSQHPNFFPQPMNMFVMFSFLEVTLEKQWSLYFTVMKPVSPVIKYQSNKTSDEKFDIQYHSKGSTTEKISLLMENERMSCV